MKKKIILASASGVRREILNKNGILVVHRHKDEKDIIDQKIKKAKTDTLPMPNTPKDPVSYTHLTLPTTPYV